MPYLALKQDPEDAQKQIPYLEDRHTLGHWADKQVEADTIHEYRSRNNAYSLDGLPGLKVARRHRGERLWLSDLRAAMRQRNSALHSALVAMVSAVLTVITMYMLGLTTFEFISAR